MNGLLTLFLILAPAIALAQYAPPSGFPLPPTGVTLLRSRIHANVSISYKETFICEETENVKGYSGYVHLPPNTMTDVDQPYPINAYFWYFAARHNPENAPSSIWMNGGPGSSSMIGLFQENGPCHILRDQTSELNPWSWNTNVNMIYFDQPVQTGFSYDTATKGASYNMQDGTQSTNIGDVDITQSIVQNGTFPSGNPLYSPNATNAAAEAAWHFAQTFFGEFPHFSPDDNRIDLWTESYGGRYGPAFAYLFEKKNQAIDAGTLHDSAIKLNLNSIGIVNGCVDIAIQQPYYPEMAWNNTYGIQVITEEQYKGAMGNWTRPVTGGKALVAACQKAVASLDPHGLGTSERANAICKDASDYLNNFVEGVFFEADSPRGYYDIAHPAADPFPPEYYTGYLNNQKIQAALGVPVNFTESSNAVYAAFTASGDYAKGGVLEQLAWAMSRGVRVAMVYGDRDYACNWLGGEAVSRAVKHTDSAAFLAAGYAPLQVNASYVGGFVRQAGNLSFTRVFEAGHEVPAYQPETAFRIFSRHTENRDIATGTVNMAKHPHHVTVGIADTFRVKNAVPVFPESECFVLQPGDSCTADQWASVLNGTAVVKDYIVQEPKPEVPHYRHNKASTKSGVFAPTTVASPPSRRARKTL
ncbi:hypothetical protein HKX48_009537 [Thoreauomyces humboldtii]|nr:hypothetical protein HKX48_009537 [Thoreauomyces humboldtii]